jgi:hypothetical protein
MEDMRTKASRRTQFGVCIDNKGYPASLEVGKLYRVVPDGEASKHGYIRVVDESGEDYGYSAERFFVLKVPQPLARALTGPSGRQARRTSHPLVPVGQKARRG